MVGRLLRQGLATASANGATRPVFVVSAPTGYAIPPAHGWPRRERPVTRSCRGRDTVHSRKLTATHSRRTRRLSRVPPRSNWQQNCQNPRAILTNRAKKLAETRVEKTDG